MDWLRRGGIAVAVMLAAAVGCIVQPVADGPDTPDAPPNVPPASQTNGTEKVVVPEPTAAPGTDPQADEAVVVPGPLTEPLAEPLGDTLVTEEPVAWAEQVRGFAADRGGAPAVHEPAVMPDRAYAHSSTVTVRRLVYRVYFLAPKTFRDQRTLARPPASELTVDVSYDRLRARFSGPTWPLPDGTEVRLRRDALGVYVFSEGRGRQLSPGQLASWFEGRGTPGIHITVRVRREILRPGTRVAPGPGELVCALLAEWTGQPRDAVLRRCSDSALPPGFAFGPWRAELTAVVPLELPAWQMRGDEQDPPSQEPGEPVRPVLAEGELSHARALRDTGVVPAATSVEQAIEGASRAVVRIVNESPSRALVFAGGVPVAWVDGHSAGVVTGLAPGRYMFGALRAFGSLALMRRPVEVPGEVRIRNTH